MKTWQFIAVLFLIFPFSTSFLHGQHDDFRLWSTAGFETGLNENFDLVFEISNRWKENISRRDETYAEAGVAFSKKWFSSGLSYRFENKNDPERKYLAGHRIVAYIKGKILLDKFSLDFRNKFHSEYLPALERENPSLLKSYDRTRIRIRYNVRSIDIDPFLCYEIFSRLNSDQLRMIEKNRFGAGFNYTIRSTNVLGIACYYQYDNRVIGLNRDYILSVSYTVELNRKN